ncbi:MAG: hypothetical protein M3P06_14090 [Acidobacteriota bacterium]|nr:hypothetical protein [Acidobacteriota bacterium]
MIIALLAVTTLVVSAAHSDVASTAPPGDVSQLRAGGQLAVDDLHVKWGSALPDDRVQLQQTLDKVCAQKDCHASRLYWYTDLDQAKEASRRMGRPILSLHLLGRLDEELSCANSRFFRTLLYSDDSIATILRDQYVLHWHSVREVPRVTIELGGGRVIRQTIAGNSAHYLLNAHGAPLDVLPGLYSPAAFRSQLEEWVTLYRTTSSGSDREALTRHHLQRLTETSASALELGIDRTPYEGVQAVWAAQMQSRSKAATEVTTLRQLKLDSGRYAKLFRPQGAAVTAEAQPVERKAPRESDVWRTIGEQEKGGVVFSESTLQLMRTKQTLTDALLDNLRRTVAADTAFNEYDLHRRVHEWFALGDVTNLHSLNERVYDELFLTPSTDPWLGLLPEETFTGIEQITITGEIALMPEMTGSL